MHTPRQQKLLITLFCGFLAVMSILYLCLPKETFSQQEKRYLAQTPEISWERISTGDFSTDVDTFMAE